MDSAPHISLPQASKVLGRRFEVCSKETEIDWNPFWQVHFLKEESGRMWVVRLRILEKTQMDSGCAVAKRE
jgi:hypothetical protein